MNSKNALIHNSKTSKLLIQSDFAVDQDFDKHKKHDKHELKVQPENRNFIFPPEEEMKMDNNYQLHLQSFGIISSTGESNNTSGRKKGLEVPPKGYFFFDDFFIEISSLHELKSKLPYSRPKCFVFFVLEGCHLPLKSQNQYVGDFKICLNCDFFIIRCNPQSPKRFTKEPSLSPPFFRFYLNGEFEGDRPITVDEGWVHEISWFSKSDSDTENSRFRFLEQNKWLNLYFNEEEIKNLKENTKYLTRTQILELNSLEDKDDLLKDLFDLMKLNSKSLYFDQFANNLENSANFVTGDQASPKNSNQKKRNRKKKKKPIKIVTKLKPPSQFNKESSSPQVIEQNNYSFPKHNLLRVKKSNTWTEKTLKPSRSKENNQEKIHPLLAQAQLQPLSDRCISNASPGPFEKQNPDCYNSSKRHSEALLERKINKYKKDSPRRSIFKIKSASKYDIQDCSSQESRHVGFILPDQHMGDNLSILSRPSDILKKTQHSITSYSSFIQTSRRDVDSFYLYFFHQIWSKIQKSTELLIKYLDSIGISMDEKKIYTLKSSIKNSNHIIHFALVQVENNRNLSSEEEFAIFNLLSIHKPINPKALECFSAAETISIIQAKCIAELEFLALIRKDLNDRQLKLAVDLIQVSDSAILSILEIYLLGFCSKFELIDNIFILERCVTLPHHDDCLTMRFMRGPEQNFVSTFEKLKNYLSGKTFKTLYQSVLNEDPPIMAILKKFSEGEIGLQEVLSLLHQLNSQSLEVDTIKLSRYNISPSFLNDIEQIFNYLHNHSFFQSHPYFPIFHSNYNNKEPGILGILELLIVDLPTNESLENLYLYGKLHLNETVNSMLSHFREREKNTYSSHDFQRWVDFFSETEMNFEEIRNLIEDTMYSYLENREGSWCDSFEEKLLAITHNLEFETRNFKINSFLLDLNEFLS